MSRAQVAVPVAVYSVTYETRAGRPYSGLERLLLKAIAEGTTTLAELEALFGVHRRVLVECVVTLVHAGWVALGGGSRDLIVTAAGQAAASGDHAPSTVRILRPQPARVLMEQATGSLVLSGEATYRVLPDDGQGIIVLPRAVHRATLDPGEVQHLLSHAKGEWVSWIDPDIFPMSSHRHYVIADIDPERGVTHNLPATFLDALEEAIGERLGTSARLRRADVVDGAQRAFARPVVEWSAPVTGDDLVVGASDHVALLRHVLESASSRLLVATAFVTERALEAVKSQAIAAAVRGVDVEIVWGYSADDPSAGRCLRMVEAMAAKADSVRAPGRVSIARTPAGSHIKMLIWDEDEHWNTCIGSFNWLSATEESPLLDISLRVRSPGLGAAAARHVADMLRGHDDPERASRSLLWDSVAADLQHIEADREPRGDDSIVRLVYGRSHETALRKALRHSSRQLIVTSHHVGEIGISRLDWEAGPDSEPRAGLVVVGDFLEGVEAATLTAAAAKAGCRAMHRAVHAKILVSDDTVLVGSYNFLSTDVLGTGSRTRELSIEVENPDLVGPIARSLANAARI